MMTLLITSRQMAWSFYVAELEAAGVASPERVLRMVSVADGLRLVPGLLRERVVVFATVGPANLPTMVALRLLRLLRWRRWPRIVRILHDQIPHADNFHGRLTDVHQRLEMALSDGIMLHSAPCRRFPARVLGVVPLIHGFLPGRPRRIDGGERQDVLFLGRLESYKGLHHVPRILDDLAALGWGGRFILVGNGEPPEILREWMARNPDRSRRLSPNSVDEQILRTIAIGLLPYDSATQSALPGAYLDYGIVPAGTDVGCLFQGLRDGGALIIAHADLVEAGGEYRTWLDRVLEITRAAQQREAVIRLGRSRIDRLRALAPELWQRSLAGACP